jgi:hypothetical protein
VRGLVPFNGEIDALREIRCGVWFPLTVKFEVYGNQIRGLVPFNGEIDALRESGAGSGSL